MAWKIYPIQSLIQHSKYWDQLVKKSCDLPFLETNFILPLLDEFGSGREILAVYYNESVWHMAAILTQGRLGTWQTFQPSQLPLGALIGPENSYASSKHLHAVYELLELLPNSILTIGLTQLDSKVYNKIEDLPFLQNKKYIDTAWIEINCSFDTYFEQRGKNLRQNIKKQNKKIKTEQLETSFECITDASLVANAINDYGVLESTGWKSTTGSSVTLENAQGRFYKKMLENFCLLGRGRIYRYKINNVVTAMDLCICSGSTIVILKTAYNESYKSYSPSTLMRYQEFKSLFEEGTFNKIEFFGRIMEWHTRWTPNSRCIYHATIYRWPWVRKLHLLVKITGF